MSSTLAVESDAGRDRSSWRRWPVSLKLFVAIVGTLALASGWFVFKVDRQRTTIRAIEQSGGTVFTQPHCPSALRDWIGEEWAGGLDTIVGVRSQNPAALEQLHSLGRLANLKYLSLNGPAIRDQDLKLLAGCRSLETLDLGESAVTDAGLVHLLRQQKLVRIDLQSTEISDAGLMHLRTLPHLEDLNLAGTRVTDRGLKYISSLKLTRINLYGTGVTLRGMQELNAAIGRAVIANRGPRQLERSCSLDDD